MHSISSVGNVCTSGRDGQLYFLPHLFINFTVMFVPSTTSTIPEVKIMQCTVHVFHCINKQGIPDHRYNENYQVSCLIACIIS